MNPYQPRDGATVNIDVSSSSQSVLVAQEAHSEQVRVTNNGSATAWIKFGTSAPTATTSADIPVPPGAIEVYTVQQGPIYAAAIAAGSTGKIFFTPGVGF